MCGFWISRKGGTEGGGWGHPQGDVHVVDSRLGCEKVMVGTGWATSHPECMDKLTKHYSVLVGGLISGKEGCLGSEWVY